MEVILKKLTIKNFMGTESREVDFNEKETIISGPNGVGKSTVEDAFHWLTIGKDSQGRTDYEIKPKDPETKKIILHLEPEVEGIFLLNDEKEVKLRRNFAENWVKKRGESESKYIGNTTNYYVDDVPQKASEYQLKINEIFGSEEALTMVTSPLHFGYMDNWKRRREIVTSMADKIPDPEGFEDLINDMDGKALDEYKKGIAYKKKRLKEDLQGIPDRIDELENQKPEQENIFMLQEDLKKTKEDLIKTDEEIINKPKAFQSVYNEIAEKESQINDLKRKASKLREDTLRENEDAQRTHEASVRSLKSKITSLQDQITQADTSLKRCNAIIPECESEIERLRRQWEEEDEKKLELNENDLVCPTCGTPFSGENLEEKEANLHQHFDEEKEKITAGIIKRGNAAKEELKATKKLVEEKQELILSLEKTKADAQTELEKALSTKAVAKSCDKELAEIQDQISKIVVPETPKVDVSDLKAKKQILTDQIEDLQKRINQQGQIAKLEARIKELKADEKNLSQQIADLEKMEIKAEQYNRLKWDAYQESVDKLFKIVKWQLSEEQFNEGIKECFNPVIDGVLFPRVNTAKKINGGIDMINVLQKYFKVTAPIFVDNAESIGKFIETNAQIIKLVHDPSLKELVIK